MPVWKMTFFWSEKGSGFREPGGTPPTGILQSNSPVTKYPRTHFDMHLKQQHIICLFVAREEHFGRGCAEKRLPRKAAKKATILVTSR